MEKEIGILLVLFVMLSSVIATVVWNILDNSGTHDDRL